MSVYVDSLCACLPNSRWKYRQSCHLFADTREELLAFAVNRLYLKAEWLQAGPPLHFDLTAGWLFRTHQNK